MATDAKKHHYNPQSVLARFSIAGGGRQVYVFDKSDDRSWPSAIRDAGSENQFNTVEIDGIRASFEGAFQEVDTRLAMLLDRLAKERSLASLGPRDLIDLADVIAVQLVRTKLIRTSMRAIAEDFARAVSNAGLKPENIVNFRIPTEQDVRVAALATLNDRALFRDALVEKRAVLVEAGDGERFWTSDNPVVMFNSFPYGDTALKAPGVEVYYPFAPDLALAFYCRSIEYKLNEVLALAPDALPAEVLSPEMREGFLDLHNAMFSGRPTSLRAKAGRFVNELLVRRASRFLYASTDDFAAARDLLARHPPLRSIETLTTVGRMGGSLPPKHNMPPGLHLVIYGWVSHYMLPVEDWDERSRFIEVSTREVGMLTAVLNDQPLQQAVLFQDGAERRGMREIKLEVEAQGQCQRIRIVHKDDGLNAILGNRLRP